MKRFYTIILYMLLFVFLASAENDVKFYMNSGEVCTVAMERIDSISFDAAEQYLILALEEKVDSLLLNEIDSIAYGELATAVQVKYCGEKAVVENPYAFDGVDVNIDGAKVTVNSTIESDVDYILSGESDNGCFKIYGTNKYTLRLNGLALVNDSGAAINSQCKKRGKIILEEGTMNSLADAVSYATSDEDEKAALFSEGQFIFEGNGSLDVTGNYKHAICSDDYIAFRGGNITVLSAASDAVHCNDSLLIEGGNLSLMAMGDGIDCDGHITISGGEIALEISGDDKKGIKALGEINIIDGGLVINASGDIAKGIKGARDINICGGNVDIRVTGNSVVELGDPSYCTAIKSDSVFTISGGVLNIEATGLASCGISADCDVNIVGGECNVSCSGGYGVYDPSLANDVEEEEPVASYIVYVSKPASTGNNNRPGGFSSSWGNIYLYDNSDNLIATLTSTVTINGTLFYYYDFGTAVAGTYYFKSDNSRGYTIRSSSFTAITGDTYYTLSSTSTTSGNVKTYTLTDVTDNYAGGTSAGSTTEKSYTAACIKSDASVNIEGGTILLSTSGDASKGIKSDADCNVVGGDLHITTTGKAAIVACDPTYCTAIKCDEDFSMNGGSVVINAQGQGGIGISSDGVLSITDGSVEITVSGAGGAYTATTGTDYYSVKALKSDAAMNLLGGTISCNATGNGGKCIVADGVLTIGDIDNTDGYPIIVANTTGAALGTTSGSAGGMGGFGGMGGNEGFNGAPKAIKGSSNVVVNGGTIYASTTQDGGEGLESKATLTINGGSIECATYDDAINAATAVVVNGGYIFAHATNNDAIDSNGTIEINDGVVLASGSNQPETGIDCDNNSFAINGGTIVATGGAASSPTAAAQYYASVSSVTVSQGRYLVFKDGSDNLLFSYKCPNSVSGASLLVSSPAFTASSHTMLYGVSSVSSPTESYFNGVFLIGGTATGGTSKSFTPVIR